MAALDFINRTATPPVSKTSGTSISDASVACTASNSLLIPMVYETGAGAPTSVTWGNRVLSQLVVQVQSGIAAAFWILRHVNNSDIRALTITWSSAIVAKGFAAYEVVDANIMDVSQSNGQVATGSPSTGTAVTTTKPKTAHMALFAARGPLNDTAGTAGLGHSLVQRFGVNGVPPISNFVAQTTSEFLRTGTGNCRATLTGATVRAWANVIVAIARKGHGQADQRRQGISPADITAIEVKFESLSLDVRDLFLNWSDANGRYEAFHSSDLVTPKCHSDNQWA